MYLMLLDWQNICIRLREFAIAHKDFLGEHRSSESQHSFLANTNVSVKHEMIVQ